MIEERYELAAGRIREMRTEETVRSPFREYFREMAGFVGMLDEVRTKIADGTYQEQGIQKLAEWNRRLYQDILPDAYETSYANPSYAVQELGEGYGQILSFLYTELRGAVAYVFERKTEYLDILYELLIEIYNLFEEETPKDEKLEQIRDHIYWYASDYCDVFAADRIR